MSTARTSSRDRVGEIRVLHVDDEPSFAEMAATFLQREDEQFSIETEASVTEGLDRLAAEQFDCVVSDYDMPRRNGIEFLKAVRESHPDLPFVLFTGKGSEEIASDAISAGVSDYLRKGSGTERYSLLANRISNLVTQYRAETRLETRAEQRRRVAELGQNALANARPESLFEQAVSVMCETLDTEYVKVLDRRPEHDDLLLRAGSGWRDGLVGAATVGTGEDSQGGHTLRSETPIVVDDLRTEERFQGPPLLVEHDIVSGVSVIIGSTDDPWGVLGVHTTERRTFTEDDINFVQNVANVLANALERNERETELARAKQRLDMAIQEAEAGIWEWDLDTDELYWSDELLELLGFTRDEFDSTINAFEDRLHPDDARRVEKAIEQALETGEPYRVEQRLKNADDEYVWFDVRGQVVPEDELMVGIGIAITERKQREQQLEALNRLTHELMHADTRDEVVEIGVETTRDLLGIEMNAIHLYDDDVDGLVPADISDAAADFIGTPPTFTGEESITWRAYQRGEPLIVDDVHEDPARYNPDTPIRSELHLPLGEHGILLAGSPCQGAFDDHDALLGEIWAGALTNALEQVDRSAQLRERERELTKQNDRLEAFTSIVSHDLRNPLNVATGRLELAAEECESDHLAHVERAHERMRTLIEDLLILAREGDAVTELEPVALAPLVENCWANVETGEATLVTDIERTIRADESRLKQLFENVIRNAVEHGGTDVTVTVGELSDGFFISDDGPGIPADERDRIFEAGFSTVPDGTGFGLNIVSEIVDAHGWEIAVTEGSGGGARFEITGVET